MPIRGESYTFYYFVPEACLRGRTPEQFHNQFNAEKEEMRKYMELLCILILREHEEKKRKS